MITPLIIQALFWILAVLSVIVGAGMLLTGAGGGRFVGLLLILFGPLVIRIYAEVLIVVFRISETLTDILDELRRSP